MPKKKEAANLVAAAGFNFQTEQGEKRVEAGAILKRGELSAEVEKLLIGKKVLIPEAAQGEKDNGGHTGI
jgi:phosphosulfolactate synthase (CoM biosynthesis protein A)